MPPSPWLLNDETLWFNHVEAMGNPNAYMHVHTIIMMNEHVRLNHTGGPAGSMKGGRQIEVAVIIGIYLLYVNNCVRSHLNPYYHRYKVIYCSIKSAKEVKETLP